MKKDLVKHFPFENFYWIDDILSEEEDEVEGERVEDTPTNGGHAGDISFDRVSLLM